MLHTMKKNNLDTIMGQKRILDTLVNSVRYNNERVTVTFNYSNPSKGASNELAQVIRIITDWWG